VEAGGHAQFPVLVTNNGTESWADPPLVGWLPIAEQGGSELHVVGRWLPVAGAGGASPEAAAATEPGVVPAPGAGGFESVEAAIAPPLPPTLDLGTLHLETGEQAVLTTLVQAPPRAGQWLLVFEVVDANGQSLALSGSAPGIIAVDVLPAGLEAGPPA
jgi:hypothetical protein